VVEGGDARRGSRVRERLRRGARRREARARGGRGRGDALMPLRSRRAPQAAPEWSRFADARPHRLVRGRDFADPVDSVVQEAEAAAAELGMVIRTVRDRLEPERAFWMQLAHAAIEPG